MIEKIKANWNKYIVGYEWKDKVDEKNKRNMDIYSEEILANLDVYLPRYSAKEHETDYGDRKTRASNSFMNYPEKIIDIYANSIYRSGPPSREGDSIEAKRFIENVDGAGTKIGEFIRNKIFLLEQIQGGCIIVVDKPQKPANISGTMTKQQQIDNKIFPYAYVYAWDQLLNFEVDRHQNLVWIIFSESFINDQGSDEKRYRYFDKMSWAVLNHEGKVTQNGNHNLKVVPVYMHYQRRNPNHRFLTPKSALDNVFRLTMKIFEYMSSLEQMIVNHVFLKLQMPSKMWEALKGQGLGNANVLTFDEEHPEAKASYVQSQYTEIDKMIDLIFRILPDKILYFATLRDKVAMPREESGEAKFIDSSDEIAGLLEKANSMEKAENAIIALARLWEGDEKDFTVTYDKVFDIQSTNEQIQEINEIMKNGTWSITFNKQLIRRLIFNVLGQVPEAVRKQIETEVKEGMDPSLNIEEMDVLMSKGILNLVKLAKQFNPELSGKTDDEVRAFMAENLKMLVGPLVEPPIVDPIE